MARTPEGKLKADCRKLAKAAGLIFWNIEGKAINGIPDTICGVVDDEGKIIEFKDKGKEPTEQQYKRIRELNEAGFRATWVDSVEGYKREVGLK